MRLVSRTARNWPPRTTARAQPLFALYARTCAPAARDALHADTAVWRWQESLRAARAEFVETSAAFDNLNTPEDFLRWERTHG